MTGLKRRPMNGTLAREERFYMMQLAPLVGSMVASVHMESMDGHALPVISFKRADGKWFELRAYCDEEGNGPGSMQVIDTTK